MLHSICLVFWPEVPGRITENLRKSFPVDIRGTLPPKGIYLFHPHGMFSMAHMTNIGLKSISNWPVKSIRGTNLNSLWYSFGINEMSEESFVPVKYANMKHVIDENQSLAVSLGGIEEIQYIKKGHMRLRIKDRKGVFRLAIETGTPLVPVLAYGENEVCDNWGNWKGFDLINCILRSWHILPLMIPSWDLYKNFAMIHLKPFDIPVVSVVGEPVAVGPAREPTDEEIRIVRSVYIKRLRELYAKTRPDTYDEELEII